MNEREFTLIFKETKKTVLSSVEKHLASRFLHAINDVVQETYLRAYKGLIKNRFDGHSSTKTWLYFIAKNESMRMNEKLMREEKKFQKSIEEYRLSKSRLSEDSFHSELSALYNLIDVLPDKYRSVMEMVSMGFSEHEISKKLSIPKGTVKSRASKGRELLQRLWTGVTKHEK